MTAGNNRVLVIAPQPFFSPRGTPFSVYYRTMIMTEMGLHIDMVTYGEGQDVDLPNLTIHRTPRFAGLGHVRIGPSVHKLFLDFFIFILTWKLLLRYRHSVVHAHEEAVFLCCLLKPIFGFQLIYDMHSSLPQQLTNFKFTTSQFIIRSFKMLEDLALARADAVITICPDLADYVDRVISDRSKHVMIENSLFDPVRISGCQQDDGGTGDGDYEGLLASLAREPRLIVYAGTLETYQGIDILLESMVTVVRQVPGVKLVVAGGTTAQTQSYAQRAHELGIGSAVLFTGQVPHGIAQRLIGLAAVQVSPRSAGTNTPLKIYSQLASGVPLVATRIYSHTQTIDDRVAVMVEAQPESMAQGIFQVLMNRDTAKRISHAAQQYYQEKFSRPVYIEKLRRIMRKLKLCVASVA